MTLCIVWRDGQSIKFCSDSRLSFGEATTSDFGIKIVRMPFRIFGPNDENGERELIVAGDLGLCFAGSAIGALMTKDALFELVSNLQAVPNYHDTGMDGIADFVKRGFEVISKEVSQALFERGKTKIVFAGYCDKQKCHRAFAMERDANNQFQFDEILKQSPDHIFVGSGSTAAELCQSATPMTDREAVRILQAVIDDPAVDGVGGNIQYGRFNGKRFQPYGVAQLDDAVHYWRGPLDLNGPAFDQANGLISNFPLLDLLSRDEG